MIRRFVPVACAAALSLIFVAACGGGGAAQGDATNAPASTTTARAKRAPPTPTATAAPLAAGPLAIRDLLALPPDGNFEVDYNWRKGVLSGRPGIFVWRQAGSNRRFDFFPGGPKTESGWFTLEQRVTPDAAASEAADVTHCTWFGPKAGEVGVTCAKDPPTRELANTIYAALGKSVTGTFPDRPIAGRGAKCYAFDAGNGGQGAICIDPRGKIPLYLGAMDPSGGRIEEIEATSVMDNIPALSLPAGLPGDVPVQTAPKMREDALQFPASVAPWR